MASGRVRPRDPRRLPGPSGPLEGAPVSRGPRHRVRQPPQGGGDRVRRHEPHSRTGGGVRQGLHPGTPRTPGLRKRRLRLPRGGAGAGRAGPGGIPRGDRPVPGLPGAGPGLRPGRRPPGRHVPGGGSPGGPPGLPLLPPPDHHGRPRGRSIPAGGGGTAPERRPGGLPRLPGRGAVSDAPRARPPLDHRLLALPRHLLLPGDAGLRDRRGLRRGRVHRVGGGVRRGPACGPRVLRDLPRVGTVRPGTGLRSRSGRHPRLRLRLPPRRLHPHHPDRALAHPLRGLLHGGDAAFRGGGGGGGGGIRSGA